VKKTIKIEEVAVFLGMMKTQKTLPNGKTVSSFEYAPSQLPEFFRAVEAERADMGREDCVEFDGGCPGWLLVCVAHACHPSQASVKYPQGGADCQVPVTGFAAERDGACEGVDFVVKEESEYTLVEFSLKNPTLDLQKALSSLVAPAVPAGKPVRISGRGPIAVLAALSSAYAHMVPYVACYQPGVGNVVSISHSDVALGTVLK